ncbi:MAG: ECF transporter S component [Rikenellaceae bacterium]
MQNDNITLYSLGFDQVRSYLLTVAFVVGNILLPQLCHLIPRGGLILLPIYLFTLVGAYKYGWRVGLMTALLSPVANHLLFGMPPAAVLPTILIKSVVLALAAGFAAQRLRRLPLLLSLAAVVACYQVVGTLAEWAIVGDLFVALQDFRIGVVGMMIQIFGGELLIRSLHSQRPNQ